MSVKMIKLMDVGETVWKIKAFFEAIAWVCNGSQPAKMKKYIPCMSLP